MNNRRFHFLFVICVALFKLIGVRVPFCYNWGGGVGFLAGHRRETAQGFENRELATSNRRTLR